MRIGTISAVDSVDAPHVGCNLADITVAPVAENVTVPKNTAGFALTAGSIVFTDTGVSQDACKGAVITLTVTSN
jgi:hypothetical protein